MHDARQTKIGGSTCDAGHILTGVAPDGPRTAAEAAAILELEADLVWRQTPRTLREISERLHLTHQRVSQIEKTAMRKIRGHVDRDAWKQTSFQSR